MNENNEHVPTITNADLFDILYKLVKVMENRPSKDLLACISDIFWECDDQDDIRKVLYKYLYPDNQ